MRIVQYLGRSLSQVWSRWPAITHSTSDHPGSSVNSPESPSSDCTEGNLKIDGGIVKLVFSIYVSSAELWDALSSLAFVVLGDLVRHVDVQELGVDPRVILRCHLQGLVASVLYFFLVSFLRNIKQRAVPCLASARNVVEVCIVTGLGADVALVVPATLTRAPHLVAARLFDEWGIA